MISNWEQILFLCPGDGMRHEHHMSNKLIPQVNISKTLDAEWSWKFLPTQAVQFSMIFSIVLFGFLESVEFWCLPQSAKTDSVRYSVLSLSTKSWIYCHSSLIFKHCILWGSLNSEFNLKNHALPPQWVSKNLLGLACLLVCLGSCSASGFPRHLCVSCCCCCLNSQTLFRTIFGAGPGVGSLWLQVSSTYHLFDAVGHHWIVNIDGVRPCLPKLQSLFLCRGQVDPAEGVLMRLPCAMIVHFSRPRHVVVEFFFWIFPKKQVKGLMKTACRPSFPFHLRWVLLVRLMSLQKSILGETGIPSISTEQRHDPSVQARSRSLQCVLLKTCSNQAESEKVFSEMRSAVSDRSISNDQHHQFLSLFLVTVANQLHTKVRDSGFQSMSFEVFIDKNVIPRSFFTWNIFIGMIVHQIRLNCWLQRMSFLSAQWHLNFHWTKFHFFRDRFPRRPIDQPIQDFLGE